jgi:ubiquinone biosynthesis protein Coq4
MPSHLKKARERILVFLTHKIALPLLKLMRRPNEFPYTEQQLQSLPPGTLGNDLFKFLEQRNLPLLKHYARHDLKHVLLGYDTTEEGEACLQSFMLGNGRISFPVLATVVYAFITMPEYHDKMKKAYHAGRESNAIHGWKWSEIVQLKTNDLRKKIFCREKQVNMDA